LKTNWKEDWEKMSSAFLPNCSVLSSLITSYSEGGNAKLLERLPPGVELGHNRNACLGGQRVWQNNPRTRRAKWTIL